MKRSMVSRRILLLIFASLSIVFAENVDHALRYRQVVPKGTGASASSATPVVATSSAPTPSEEPEPSSTPESDPRTTSIATSRNPDPVSDSESTSTSPTEEDPVSTSSPTDASDVVSESTPASETEAATDPTASSESPVTSTGPASPISSEALSSTTQVVVSTIVVVQGGTSSTNVITSTALLAVPAAATSKGAPRIDGNAEDSGSSGLKDSDRKVIIGTVVGIGGAILLGGIGVVLWRIWGKRKHQTDDDRDLMDSQPGSSGREKRSSISGNSPFRSTLDQYHNPAGPVNTASNF